MQDLQDKKGAGRDRDRLGEMYRARWAGLESKTGWARRDRRGYSGVARLAGLDRQDKTGGAKVVMLDWQTKPGMQDQVTCNMRQAQGDGCSLLKYLSLGGKLMPLVTL